jgi:hypothetical protein
MFRVVFWDIQGSSLMMEAVRTSETSVNNFTRQYIPEDNSEHHTRRHENLKSQIQAQSRFFLSDLVVYFTTIFQLFRPFSVKWRGNPWILNLNGFRMKQLWTNFMALSWQSPGRTEESHKHVSQDSQSPVLDLNAAPPKYETGVLTSRPRRLVKLICYHTICPVRFRLLTIIIRWLYVHRQQYF